VQQEISNARQLELQCGRTLLPFACLVNFIEVWEEIDAIHEDDYTFLPIGSPFAYTINRKFLSKLRGRGIFGNRPMNLIEILCKSRELTCTDDRDIVYGLMFLSHCWQENDLVVDYSSAVSEVFRQAMISFLKVYGSIAFLEHANFSYSGYEYIKDKTPSWVPDWRKKTQRRPSEEPIRLRNAYSRLAHISGDFLSTTGVKVAEVWRYYDYWSHHGGTLDVPSRAFFYHFCLIVEEAKHPKVYKRRMRHLFWILTEATKATPIMQDNEDFVEAFEVFSRVLESTIHSPADSDCGSPNTLNDLLWKPRLEEQQHEDYMDDIERDEQEDYMDDIERDELEELHDTMSKNLSRQIELEAARFAPFVSQTGSIGLAPLNTQPGDEVWLIPTCRSPIILRPCDGNYLVLGKAWLDNEMYWGHFGGVCDFLTEGDVYDQYKVEALCLK